MVVAVRPAECQMVRVANIGIVESEAVADAVIGQLDEGPEFVGDFAGVEEAHLLRKEQVAVLGQRARDARCPAAPCSCAYRRSAAIRLMGGMELSASVS